MDREEHACKAQCSYKGICQIEPQSNKAIFVGRHEKFQYTKVTPSYSVIHCASLLISGLLFSTRKVC